MFVIIIIIIRYAPAYFDIIYALMPSYYKNKAACKIVHKFSMDVIRQRRSELQVCSYRISEDIIMIMIVIE